MKRSGTNPYDLPSVWDLDDEMEWAVQDLIPLSGITLFCAHSGTGKTWVAHAIAGAVANGQPFVGLETKQLPVLYLDRENPLVVVKRNLDQLGIGRVEEFRIWGGWNEKPPANLNELLEYAEKHRPFLVVDALVRFNPGDEQSAKDTSAFMQPIRQLANLGATVLLLHHTEIGRAHV